MAGVMKAPPSGVKIRMYRQGQGDCFLLALPGNQGKTVHVLIDCGLYHTDGTEDELKAKMLQIAEHVKASAGDHLDLVVVTHEHSDHINGFHYAQEVFKGITVDRVWMAWTENPDDETVKRIKDELDLEMQLFAEVAKRIRGFGASAVANTVNALLAHSDHNPESMEILRALAAPEYLQQGQGPMELSGAPGVRFFVLSPPHDYDFVMKYPSGSPGDVYGFTALPTNAQSAFLAAIFATATSGLMDIPDEETIKKESAEASQPFDSKYGLPLKTVQEGPWRDFFRHYGFKDGAGEGPKWRRIDLDWLRTAEPLALKMGSRVNNTSLVLAMQLVDSGDVLLFTGDAQAESWHSWYDNEVSWEIDGEVITAEDLLRKTVYYKTSHHGSHNGTLKSKGLEIMDDSRLVSMIPVGKNGFGHPHQEVLAALIRKAKGRVLILDKDLIKDKPANISDQAWKAFTDINKSSPDDLYVDYTLTPTPPQA